MTAAGRMDADLLARVYHAAQYRSRRQAKRILRDAGGAGTAAELDQVLADLHAREDAVEIYRHANLIEQAANDSAQAAYNDSEERFVVGFGADTGARMIVHLCPGGSWSFVGRLTPPTMAYDESEESHLLVPAGLRLVDIVWLDGHRPEDDDLVRLLEAAAQAICEVDRRFR